MIETMGRSTGSVLGYEISGTVTTADYDTLARAVGAAIDEHGSVSLLLDLRGFHWEKVSAWGADLRFGREYHEKIDKMAIVGDKKWEKHLATLASPYYARESRYFEAGDAGWEWLQG